MLVNAQNLWKTFSKPLEIFEIHLEIFGKPLEIFGKPLEVFGKPQEIFGKHFEIVCRPAAGGQTQYCGKNTRDTKNNHKRHSMIEIHRFPSIT